MIIVWLFVVGLCVLYVYVCAWYDMPGSERGGGKKKKKRKTKKKEKKRGETERKKGSIFLAKEATLHAKPTVCPTPQY